MDYYMLLQAAGGESDKNVEKVKKEVTSFNTTCFAKALMWVLGEMFEGNATGCCENPMRRMLVSF